MLVVFVVGHAWSEIWIAAEKLARSGNDASRMFGTTYAQILTLDGDLLQHECLSSFFSGSKVCKCIVSICRNPAADNRVASLEHL